MLPMIPLGLPYPLIDIQSGGAHFRFLCTDIPENQTEYTIRQGGIECRFGIEYEGFGLSAKFGCDITVGNVYAFYRSLDDIYNMLAATQTAMLENYGSLDRTSLSVSFDARGGCLIAGSFMNRDSRYQSGIRIHMESDQSDISDSIKAMQHFFRILAAAQGHFNFY